MLDRYGAVVECEARWGLQCDCSRATFRGEAIKVEPDQLFRFQRTIGIEIEACGFGGDANCARIGITSRAQGSIRDGLAGDLRVTDPGISVQHRMVIEIVTFDAQIKMADC